MNITVYLASSEGKDPALKEAVRAFGTWIGESGNALVYGGSKSGLMGILAESVVEAGGEATGVEPQFFIDAVLQYEGLTRLIATKDMTERKAIMIELGDAFVAFPGGTGTLEEISEIMSKVCLAHLDAPCILYNHNGYYDGLKQLLRTMVEQGLASESQLSLIHFADSVEEICDLLGKAEQLWT
jgi:uncharacterized protein (TIGR00730 family)